MMPVAAVEDRFWSDVFPGVAADAVEREPELSENIEIYSRELRRFLAIARTSDLPLAMISKRVDALWHELINHTITYREYCDTVAGRFIDHMPRSEWFPIPDSAIANLLGRYREAHGELPDAWFDGMDAAVAAALRAGRNPAGSKWSGYVPTNR